MKMPKIDIKLEISPAIMIYFGENKIGEITFNNMENMGKFLERLRGTTEFLIKEFDKKEADNNKRI